MRRSEISSNFQVICNVYAVLLFLLSQTEALRALYSICLDRTADKILSIREDMRTCNPCPNFLYSDSEGRKCRSSSVLYAKRLSPWRSNPFATIVGSARKPKAIRRDAYDKSKDKDMQNLGEDRPRVGNTTNSNPVFANKGDKNSNGASLYLWGQRKEKKNNWNRDPQNAKSTCILKSSDIDKSSALTNSGTENVENAGKVNEIFAKERVSAFEWWPPSGVRNLLIYFLLFLSFHTSCATT